MVSLYTAMNIALCVRQDPVYGNPIFDCKPDEAFETLKALRAEIERLRAELGSQTQWAELLAGNNCYCIPDDVGVCLPCAYRQTMRQNEEARRG